MKWIHDNITCAHHRLETRHYSAECLQQSTKAFHVECYHISWERLDHKTIRANSDTCECMAGMTTLHIVIGHNSLTVRTSQNISQTNSTLKGSGTTHTSSVSIDTGSVLTSPSRAVLDRFANIFCKRKTDSSTSNARQTVVHQEATQLDIYNDVVLRNHNIHSCDFSTLLF